MRSDGAVEKMGKASTRAGRAGEVRLDKAFAANSRTCDYARWRSLRMPQAASGKRYGSDVDFALASGDTILLVDAKAWRGRFLWSMSGHVMDGFRPVRDKDGSRRKVGRNMSMAVDLFQRQCDMVQDRMRREGRRVKPVTVKALVLFVPTARNMSPSSVRFLRFPGTEGSALVEPGLRKAARVLGKPRFDELGALRVNPVAEAVLDAHVF